MRSNEYEVLVVGAGIAGLTAAAAAAGRGLRVALVSTGPGSFVFGAGSVEAQSLDPSTPGLEEAMAFFREFTAAAGVPFYGGLGGPRLIPTIMGSFQLVSMAPFYLWAGDPLQSTEVAVVGIRGLSSFDANFIAERLAFHAGRMERGSRYRAAEIELSTCEETLPSTLQYANRYDRQRDFREELKEKLKPIAAKVGALILPGILGLKSGQAEIEWLERELACRICELPTLPPSAPGMRLYNRMEARLRRIGVELYTGFPIERLEREGERCTGALLATPARAQRLVAETVILATGPFSARLLGAEAVGFNRDLHPVDAAGKALSTNVYATGTILRGARSSSGAHGGNALAILTGYLGGLRAAGSMEYLPLPASLGDAGVQYA